jgi:preprotein translocase subunit SecD
VAAPPAPASRPGRYLAALALLIVVLLAAIIGGAIVHPGSWHSRFKVGLGLDLSSGTTVTLSAVPKKTGAPVDQNAMKQAVTILLDRVNGAGLNGATVQQVGSRIINVSVPGQRPDKVLQLVGTTAELRFRQVLLCSPPAGGVSASCFNSNPTAPTPPSPVPSAPAGSPSPGHTGSSGGTTGSSTPSGKPSASTKAAVRTHGQPRAAVQAQAARLAPAAAVAAAATPSPSSPGSPRASGSGSPRPAGSGSPTGSVSPSAPASTPAGTSYVAGDPSLAKPAALKLFQKLKCPVGGGTKWQQKIYGGNPYAYNNPGAQIVSCAPDGTKYLLGTAVVTGAQLTGAQANQLQTSQWVVDLTLNGAATKKFGQLTSELNSKYFSGGQATSVLDEFAIVLDGEVNSAPTINAPIVDGRPEISGGGAAGFTRQQSTNLANVLKYGELQLTFVKQSVDSVSAQLGASQLSAGLIAGMIGLLLVVIYSFLYYRGLAVVSVFSLAIAALLSWLTVIVLTWHAGFTLSLAGVAGLIVAIGITADSFVVFFERLRDEVREGKSLRAAVERGWQRARRTILVSDTVSFIAAALLYYFAIGDVKGFAFTLGLTTLIDILVVFLFTKPMVTLLARTKFFGRGHKLSGLDPARLGARSPWRGSRVPARTAPGTASAAAPASASPKEA